MTAVRVPIARPIPEIVADLEAQDARGQLIVILPTELRRLLAAVRDGNADALGLASELSDSNPHSHEKK